MAWPVVIRWKIIRLISYDAHALSTLSGHKQHTLSVIIPDEILVFKRIKKCNETVQTKSFPSPCSYCFCAFSIMTPYLFALLWGPLLFRGLVCRRCNVTVSSWVDEPLYKTGLTVHPRPNSHFTCLPAHAFHKYNNTKVCVSHRCNNRPILITWFNWYCGKVKFYIYIYMFIYVYVYIYYIYTIFDSTTHPLISMEV